jgi:hypothetical protein
VLSQQNGRREGRLLRRCRELFVRLRVVGHHLLAERHDGRAGPFAVAGFGRHPNVTINWSGCWRRDA